MRSLTQRQDLRRPLHFVFGGAGRDVRACAGTAFGPNLELSSAIPPTRRNHGNAVSVFQRRNSAAAPATVSGEPYAH
jgi:hypothetical protein